MPHLNHLQIHNIDCISLGFMAHESLFDRDLIELQTGYQVYQNGLNFQKSLCTLGQGIRIMMTTRFCIMWVRSTVPQDGQSGQKSKNLLIKMESSGSPLNEACHLELNFLRHSLARTSLAFGYCRFGTKLNLVLNYCDTCVQ